LDGRQRYLWVQDPETGLVGYCCVLGLNVYLGAEGLDTYLKIQTGEMTQDDLDMLYSQDALVAHWENRSLLAPEDLQIIRNLGLKFKGKKAWPGFRRFEPGFPLGSINPWEAGFLTLALRLKENATSLPPPEHGICLVRIPEIKERNLVWQEEERPYFPQTALWVDQVSSQVLSVEFFPHPGFEKAFQNHFLSLLEQLERIPREIRMKKIAVLQLLQPITNPLNIPVALKNDLPNLEDAR
jgi:hypothetical protein